MFKLNDIKIADDFDDKLNKTRIIDVVRFGKPQPNEWFRLFNLGSGLKSFANVVLTKQPDAKGEVQDYILSSDIGNKYANKLKPFTRTILTYGYTTTGIVFIWPLNYNPEYPDLSWHLTARSIAESAFDEWTQMQSDKAQRAYLHFVMQKDNADQVKDPFNNTPPIDYERAVQLSIQQRYVDSEDHLIIKNLGVKKD